MAALCSSAAVRQTASVQLQRRQPAAALSLLAAAALLLLAAVAVTPAHAAVNNTVTAWEDLAQSAVRTYGIPAQLANRLYALVALASFKAIDGNPSVAPSAAAAVAGHAVLSTLFPQLQSSMYDGVLAKQLAAAATTTARASNATTRAAIAEEASSLARNAIGGASAAPPSFQFPDKAPYVYQAAPGQKFALLPQLGDAAPLLASQARLSEIAGNRDLRKGPVFLPPRPHGADYNATFRLGRNDSAERRAYDTDSAFFWADGANTSGPSGHWLNITFKVLPNDTSVRDTALTLARAFGAAWDATIACFKVKYSVLYWRPVTAFNQGYPADGKVAAFEGDPMWAPLLKMTPPHPEYPSGHLCTTGAIVEALIKTLGTDKVSFSIGSEGAPQLGERKYDSLLAAANEVADSRVYAGVHFNSSNLDGLRLGRLVATEVYKTLGKAKLNAGDSKPAAVVDEGVGGGDEKVLGDGEKVGSSGATKAAAAASSARRLFMMKR